MLEFLLATVAKGSFKPSNQKRYPSFYTDLKIWSLWSENHTADLTSSLESKSTHFTRSLRFRSPMKAENALDKKSDLGYLSFSDKYLGAL